MSVEPSGWPNLRPAILPSAARAVSPNPATAAMASPGASDPTQRRHLIPVALMAMSICAYVGTALATGQHDQLTSTGAMNLLQCMVALGLVALGQNLVMLGGSIDLSVANVISVSAVLASYFMQGDSGAVGWAVIAVLMVAAAVGAFNGLLVTRLGLSPLIATLGVGLGLHGLLSVAFIALQGEVPQSFRALARASVGGVPLAVPALAAVAIVSAFALGRTAAGERLRQVGSHRHSARLADVHAGRVLLGAHMVAGLMAGLAGLYLASWSGAGTPWVGRDGGYDLDSIAAVVIGGTLLAGRGGSIAGTMAGVFAFAAMDAVFQMLRIDPFFSQVVRGAVVVIAVGVYTFRHEEPTA